MVIDVLYAVMAGSLILAWPYHLQDLYYTYLDSYIMDNRIYRWALLKSVVTLGVIGLFVYECRMILRARKDITLEFNYQIRVALFAGVSVVVFAIMYLLLPDGKFSFFGVIACLFKGVSMAFMPALLMYDVRSGLSSLRPLGAHPDPPGQGCVPLDPRTPWVLHLHGHCEPDLLPLHDDRVYIRQSLQFLERRQWAQRSD